MAWREALRMSVPLPGRSNDIDYERNQEQYFNQALSSLFLRLTEYHNGFNASMLLSIVNRGTDHHRHALLFKVDPQSTCRRDGVF